MLKITPPEYRFCPFCGGKLGLKRLEGANRKFCPKDDWIYFPHVPTASGAIIEKAGKVFLVQRNREPYKGTWMFPAGFTSFGEHPKEAAIREALEETGLSVVNPRLLDVVQVIDDPREPGHFIFFYQVDLTNTQPRKISDQEENQSMGWFPINNLPEIGWESHQQIMNYLQKNQAK